MSAVWERQEGESQPAYEAFKVFLGMSGGRTNKAVSEHLGRSRSLIDGWAAKYSWRERARAYDNYLERRELDVMLAIREVSLTEYRQSLDAGLQAKLILIDQIASEELRRLREAQGRGDQVNYLELKRLISALNEADTLARRSAGLPTQFRTAQAGEGAEEAEMYYIETEDENEG